MKTRDQKHIDKLFRSKLYNNEIQPSEGSWQKVSDSIMRDKFSTLEVKPSDASWERLNQKLSQENSISYRRVIMIAASMCLIMILGYLLINNQIIQTTVEPTTAENQQETEIASNDLIKSPGTSIQKNTTSKEDKKEDIVKTVATNATSVNEKGDPANFQLVQEADLAETFIALDKKEITISYTLPQLGLDKEISERSSEDIILSVSKLSFRDKLKNTWQGIRNLKESEEKLIDLPKAKNDFFAKASKGLQNGFQKLKINRNNDEETDD